MKMSSATIEIKVSPEKVWGILTDAAKYTEWDRGMISLEGRIAPGEKLTIYAKIAPNRAFKVTVSEFVPNTKMVWSSGMPLGLFKGNRSFTLEPLGNNQVKFTIQEAFSGLLLPLIRGTIPDLNPTFATYVSALKARAEQAI
jgi:hypothetical protein